MKLLDRYMLQQFLFTFILVIVGVPFLFIITDVTDQLDSYLARGIGMETIAVSYLYSLPQFLFWSFPIGALIATVFTVGNMTRHQEVTAAKAGGVSFYRLTRPVFLAAAILSLVAVGIGELVPIANQTRSRMLDPQEFLASSYRMNFVFRTEDGRTLSAGRYSAASQEMDNVVLIQRIENEGLTIHQAAATANFSDESGWTLHDGYTRWIEDEGDRATMYFRALAVPTLEEGPDELMANSDRDAEEMQYRELEEYIRMIDRSGGDTNEYRVHLAQKLALPMAVFVIVLFGAPLATSNRRGGAAFGVGLSLIVTMTYLMLFKVGEALGISGAVDPIVAAWAPNALFAVGALLLLIRVRT